MELKHACTLKGLFWTFEDNIRDAKYLVEYMEGAKNSEDMEHAQFFLNKAKTRIEDNETIKSKMDGIIKKYPDVENNPMKILYDMKIEEYQDLKTRIMKLSV